MTRFLHPKADSFLCSSQSTDDLIKVRFYYFAINVTLINPVIATADEMKDRTRIWKPEIIVERYFGMIFLQPSKLSGSSTWM